jgi:hypothetical protein
LGEEAMDSVRQHMGFEFHLLPGAARDSPAGDLEKLLPATIVDKGNIGVVEATAVRLEDQPLRTPEEVRPKAPVANLEWHVDLRLWQAGL